MHYSELLELSADLIEIARSLRVDDAPSQIPDAREKESQDTRVAYTVRGYELPSTTVFLKTAVDHSSGGPGGHYTAPSKYCIHGRRHIPGVPDIGTWYYSLVLRQSDTLASSCPRSLTDTVQTLPRQACPQYTITWGGGPISTGDKRASTTQDAN